jgi:5-methylcytosine-specific restriction protein A
MKLANPNKRSTEEWWGRTPDTPFPDYVRLRIAERDRWICQCGCETPIHPTRDAWDTDHKNAIVNGGENRESNGATYHRKHHQQFKTPADLAEKSDRYAKQRRHFGMKKGGTIPYRRFNGTAVYPKGRR